MPPTPEHRGPGYDGSEQAVARITSAQRPLYAYIRSLVASPDDVDDVLQEVNLVLWRKIGEFDGRGPFLTWACHVAYLQVLAHHKRRRRDRHEAMDETALEAVSAAMAAAIEGLDDRLDALRRCLAELNPEHRRMILRRYELGGSVEAVAVELGRPAGSVRVTLHRIRLALNACMGRDHAAGRLP